MRKNTIISNFKRPQALVITTLFVLLTEIFVFNQRAHFVKDYWDKFVINESRLVDSGGYFPLLLMGNSIQKTAVRPAQVSKGLLSLGLAGAKPMSHYLMLQRYLKYHKAPEVLFLYVDPEDQHEAFYVIMQFYMNFKEYLSVWNDLSWRERKIYLDKYFPTLNLRQLELEKRPEYSGPNKKFVQDLFNNRGFMPLPMEGESIPADFFDTHKSRIQKHISINERDRHYLDRLMRLASANKIQVVFLGMAVPKGFRERPEMAAFFSEYAALFESLKNKYSYALFDEEPVAVFGNEYFGDHSHFNSKGSELYTEYFKTKFFKDS